LGATVNEERTRATGSLGARARAFFERNVCWLTDARRDFSGAPSERAALLVVVGREHYVERRRSYPVTDWRDLSRVLALELASTPDTLAHIGPTVEDRRDVTFYDFQPGALARAGRTAWVLPESLLVARSMRPGQIATVERAGFRYLVAATGESAPARGAIASAEMFANAIGEPSGEFVGPWNEAALRDRMRASLRTLPSGAWLRFLRLTLRPEWPIAWRPLLLAGGVAVLGYFLLVSAYLQGTLQLRERQLDALGPEISTLLKTQTEVEKLTAERQAVAKLLAGREPTQEIWRLAGVAWGKGAQIAQVRFTDGKVAIQGNAATATDVLAALAAQPGVKDARFTAPVRREGAREEFVISLVLTSVPPPKPTAAAAAPPAGAARG
jgi:hypothetical protein